MTKTLTDSIVQLFRPQLPQWACEFTARHVIVAGVDANRSRIQSKTASEMAIGADRDRQKTVVRDLLRAASFKGSEIAVVIPDESARIAFVTAETLPKTLKEQHTFIRWKLKKSVPFDVDTAQVAFRVVETKSDGLELLVALSPREVVERYENLMEELDIHAGHVVPSTLAALNLVNPPADDMLFVKVAPDCVTTTVFQNRHVRFYRRVAELGLYESVYPTVLYYQDKLGGTAFRQMIVCSYQPDSKDAVAELQERIGIPAQALEPRHVEDIYKPALGAVHLSWANLI